MDASYFLLDTTHPALNALLNVARLKCRDMLPANVPSVARLGNRAVVKIAGVPKGWIHSPVLIKAYSAAEHEQLKVDMAVLGPLATWK